MLVPGDPEPAGLGEHGDRRLGHAPLRVLAGGVALLADAALLLPAPTRPAAAGATATMITVFAVAHVDALVHAPAGRRWSPALKVLLNVAYVGWAIAVAVS
ncbi:hypothetical protein [Actinoplanes couchii]|uniref:YhhN family protein n=1 Tax=Actinoplanes couchii TaxID=403638 RepID=A0ABQ3XNP8_9ACTN|nr:hypothetical protein [Actinoplanes couchii]MDR6319633.1 putative membrane protein YphA (DoxX/SURF4 family) [Actinoplanes couchii]GID60144.1 hypothetical protein Aco03nite_085480 [Actinoplanes couchii]